MQGVSTHSRNYQNVEDEPPSTFHVRKERINSQKSKIDRTQKENGGICNNSSSIYHYIEIFFKKIFQNEGHNDEPRKRVDSMFIEGITDKLHAIVECPLNKEIVTWLSNQLSKLRVTGNIVS